MPPSDFHASTLFLWKYEIMYSGFKARKTLGSLLMMLYTPIKPIEMNHVNTTGANMKPTCEIVIQRSIFLLRHLNLEPYESPAEIVQ
jgi:hypothetical protein